MIPVELQVVGSQLRAIAEEMGAALVRAAFSANIKERRDCSTALFDVGPHDRPPSTSRAPRRDARGVAAVAAHDRRRGGGR